MGHRALADLTWLCYMITQPVGRPPVKCLPALMNGSNMSRITTRHAMLSLMASHNARVPPMESEEEKDGGRGWQLSCKGREIDIMNACLPVAIEGSKQKKRRVLI